MAKIVSPVWSHASGSIVGTTYLTTPAGQIIARGRTRPVQGQSTYTNQARMALSSAAAQWNTMTSIKRNAWNAVAPTFGKTGRHLFIGGRQLQEYMVLRSLITPAPVVTDDAPTVGSVPSFTYAQTTPVLPPATPYIELTLTNLQKVATAFLLDISPPLVEARNFWKGPWDTTKSIAVKALSLAAVKALISGLVLGNYYVIRIRPWYTPASPDTLKGVIAGTVHYFRGPSVAGTP